MKLAAWIEKNLTVIIATLAAIYGGYITGQVTTGSRLDVLEAKVAAFELMKPAFEQRLCRLEALNNMGECKR